MAFLICLVVPAVITAAEAPDTLWTRTFGGPNYDWAWWVEETMDEGLIIAGYTYTEPYGQGEENMYVVKTDRDGNVVWDHEYGDSLYDIATCIRQLGDGGYVMCGYSNSYPPGGADFRVLRLNAIGEVDWAYDYGGEFTADYANGICQVQDGGFIVVGSNSTEGVYILKINSMGIQINEEFVAISGTPHRVQATFDGGAIMVGGASSLYVMKLNANGGNSWLKSYGGASAGYSVIQLADSGYAVFGHKEYPLLDDDFWLIRLNKDGDSLWTRHYGNKYNDRGYSVRQTYDGGFIMAGNMFPENGIDYQEFYIVRTDSLGDTLWTKTVGGDQPEYAYCMQMTSDSGYVIVGRTRSYGAGDYDYYLVKLAKDSIEPAVDVGEWEGTTLPDFKLEQNYPNPFNPSTVIEFSLPRRAAVAVSIYDVLGRVIARPVSEEYGAGNHRINWDGKNSYGERVSTGVYFYRIEAGDFVETRKMLLLK